MAKGNEVLLQEKDIIIARKDREYVKLRDVLAETQTDFQVVTSVVSSGHLMVNAIHTGNAGPQQ